MKKGILWLTISCLVIISMILVSCGKAQEAIAPPTQTQTKTLTTPSIPAGVETVKDSLGRTVEKPKYGGNFILAWNTAPQVFDEALLHPTNSPTLQLTHEELHTLNWAKGQTGSNEWDATVAMETPNSPAGIKVGQIAESWSFPDANTVIFKIRPGIKWQNKAPYGPWSGRELTAEDVAFSMIRNWTLPTAYFTTSYPFNDYLESITATDRYTVVCKCKPGRAAMVFKMGGDHLKQVPKDACEAFGNFENWQNNIGSGPYMLVDYVVNSTAKFVRNPDYWGKDPLNPGNKLPYLDSVEVLIMPDTASRLAALRTGQLDRLGGNYGVVGRDDAKSLMQTNPSLKYREYLDARSPGLYFRCNKPELPTYNIKVRQALSMAIDRKAILDGLYSGKGILFSWPLSPLPGWEKVYKPLDQMSPLIQKIMGYYPEEAKTLLAEAGFPNGFDAEILCTNPDVDMLSIVKRYWADIKVNLNINVVDGGTWTSMTNNKTHKDMAYKTISATSAIELRDIGTGQQANFGEISDAYLDKTRESLLSEFDLNKKMEIMANEVRQYLLEKAYIGVLPASYSYVFWQPWVKGYNGEDSCGITNYGNFVFYIWMDKDMKKAATGN